MSVEQVARNFVSNMNDPKKLEGMLTADAMASGGVLPQPMPAMESFKLMGGLLAGFPDLKVDIQQVLVNGDQAKVYVNLSGTQTGTLSMPMPGMPDIPPSGKKVAAKDLFVVTVQGDKISHLSVESPADGGIPAILAQIGVKMAGM